MDLQKTLRGLFQQVNLFYKINFVYPGFEIRLPQIRFTWGIFQVAENGSQRKGFSIKCLNRS